MDLPSEGRRIQKSTYPMIPYRGHSGGNKHMETEKVRGCQVGVARGGVNSKGNFGRCDRSVLYLNCLPNSRHW